MSLGDMEELPGGWAAPGTLKKQLLVSFHPYEPLLPADPTSVPYAGCSDYLCPTPTLICISPVYIRRKCREECRDFMPHGIPTHCPTLQGMESKSQEQAKGQSPLWPLASP